MKFNYFDPEVSGGLGLQTEMDNTVHPPVVKKLHYQFEGWMGNDIVESFPCYIITDRLKKNFEQSGLTGCFFDDVLITTSGNFDQLYPNRKLSDFHWLKISGIVGVDDFGISIEDHRLVVSSKALSILTLFNIDTANIEEF